MPMRYTRRQLRQITGLPDKTLRWLLDKLDIPPVDIELTMFGSPIYVYDDFALDALHDYVFNREIKKQEKSQGKRCRGGCNRYLPPEQLNSQEICPHCRRVKWLLNEATHNDPLLNPVDADVLNDLREILQTISGR